MTAPMIGTATVILELVAVSKKYGDIAVFFRKDYEVTSNISNLIFTTSFIIIFILEFEQLGPPCGLKMPTHLGW